jgi:dipeptidyl aminopeptidase/acylaminoacyl peptidase
VSDAVTEGSRWIEDRLPERTRVACVPVRTAALLLLALALAGCGGSESASNVAELGDYDEQQPLRTKIEAENSGSTDVSFQSPRGGDVEATVVLPPDAGQGKPYPAAVYLHPYRFSRALYYREAFDLAERGIAVLLVNGVMTRPDIAQVDLLDPVYAADSFRSIVRHDLVDLRRALDYLERRDDIDDRIAVVGQEYGALSAGALAAVDDRVDALVLSAVPAEPSRYWAKEFVPQETFDSFHELLRDFDPVRLLSAFDGEVLIQNPRRDDDWPLEEYERLAKDADGAEVKWYPDYGHDMGPDADTDRQEWLAQKLTQR